MTRNEKVQLILAKREKKIRLSRTNFWVYCKTLSPEFYKESRPHLKKLCNDLQDFYEGRLLKPDNTPYMNLMINLPPQHGKSRTLIMFTSWVMGIDRNEKAITCSYNDDLATDFSKYTRNTISQEKQLPEDIVYSDIFPDTRIKHGDSSYKKWALEGKHFSYLGAGIGAGITGKSGTIRIVDDLVKDKQTACNEDALQTIWSWFTDTFLSRRGEGKIRTIMCATRWSDKDPCGMILSGPTKDEWYVIKTEVYNEDTNEMLCNDILTYKDYLGIKSLMDPMIFSANYHQVTINQQGRLYKSLREYDTLPEKVEKIIAVVDTADTGKNKLAMIIAALYKGQAYILDMYYTADPMEITEPEVAKRLFEYKVDTAIIESNNGGRGFARNVERLLWSNHKSRQTRVRWFHQSFNKVARILSNATNVMNNIFFPINWKHKYRDAYDHITAYQRQGKNKSDDIEDVLTMLSEELTKPRAMSTDKRLNV